MIGPAAAELRAYVEYLRDLGIHDLYRQGEPLPASEIARLLGVAEVAARPVRPAAAPVERAAVPAARAAAVEPPLLSEPSLKPLIVQSGPAVLAARPSFLEAPVAKPAGLDELYPLSKIRIAAEEHAAALTAIQTRIGDCTRCPLAYAGRRKIVFGDGDPAARLMFVGEGPGADEDEQGLPFVGKAGQLLNNMIAAMGLRRDQVYIANIVKCRPPQNRVPEPVEAGTCSQFLVEQIDVVQPEVIVALGATAAMYLLGVKQPLASLRGGWHACRGAKVAVTYHPAFLLRDPRQKVEAWKDLQRVMGELGLKAPVKAGAAS